MLDFLKKNIRAQHVIIIAVNALCLAALIVCLVLSASVKAPLRSQQAADAWAGQSGERFAQLSVFFTDSSGFNEEGIHGLLASLDSALLSVSLESTPDRDLYTHAWSASGEVSISSERGSATAPAIGVGGDFFLFHPLYLRSGTYLSPNDVMKDRVVLDEELAWRLYGSVQIAGFQVLINEKPFTVAGVISREKDFASAKAYGGAISRESDFAGARPNTGGAGLFMSFEALAEMTGGETGITCYEIVMPDPITGFALSSLTDAVTDPDAHIVENSARFSLGKSFAAIGSFGERSMRIDAMAYPYWENAARYAEDLRALLLVLTLLFAICPVVFGVIYLVKLIRYLIKRGKRLYTRIIAEIDRRKYEKYVSEHYNEPQIYDVDDIIRDMHGDE